MESCCFRFTPAEGGSRLASVAGTKNIIIAQYTAFVPVRGLLQHAYQIRGLLSDGKQRSVYLTRASRVKCVAYELKILTDLTVTEALEYDDVPNWQEELESNEVLVCTSGVLKKILEEQIIRINQINFLVIDSCHLIFVDNNLKYIMKIYKHTQTSTKPSILGLTYPIFSTTAKDYKEKHLSSNKEGIKTTEKERDKRESDNSDEILKNMTNQKCDDKLEVDGKIVNENNDKLQVDEKIDNKNDETISNKDNLEVNDDDAVTNNEMREIENKNDSDYALKEKDNNITVISEVNVIENGDIKKLDNSDTEIKDQNSTDNTAEITNDKDKLINEDVSATETDSGVKTPDEIEYIKGIEKHEGAKETDNITKDLKLGTNGYEDVGVYTNLDDFDMYEKLEWKLEELEKELCSKMDLAEDVDGGKRLQSTLTKPKEVILEFSGKPSREKLSQEYIEMEKYMIETIEHAMEYLNDHRYDPTEIYGDEMYEEFINIPDPTNEPKHIFKQFLYVLDQLGPYAADKAAFSLLTKLEKLKIKVPYERHFLLFCLCTSVFVKIRCYVDQVFSKYESEWEKIQLFCTPKVLRFAEILEKFKPPDSKKDSENEIDDKGISRNSNDANGRNVEVENGRNAQIKDLLNDIEKCDFVTLGNKIEDKINILEANLKNIELNETDNNDDKNNFNSHKDNNEASSRINEDGRNDDANGRNEEIGRKIETTNEKCDEYSKNDEICKYANDKHVDKDSHKEGVQRNVLGFPRRTRMRGRNRVPRNNATRIQQMQQNPDALCGIVFMKEPLMAKIMFMIVVDLSRCNSGLSYLNGQYCAVEYSGTEPKECQRQGKKQENVLKKFRMHECNLLLATPALEEGIDLPRCNLVLRWDLPPSYRSYELCRGRARATRACCVLMSQDGSTDSNLLDQVATYKELDQIIRRKCGCGIQNEPSQAEEDHADLFTTIVKPYTPIEINNDKSAKVKSDNAKRIDINDETNNDNNENNSNAVTNNDDNENNSNAVTNNDNNEKCDNDNFVCNKCNREKTSCDNVCVCDVERSGVDKKFDSEYASVDLTTAIALINRYCGKLPSDTFTRLAPQWWIEEVQLPTRTGDMKAAYICTLRLPLNCPVKYNIVGHPMPTRVLARRMVALQACRILHKSGELDDQLMPIGKENFKAAELDTGAMANGDVTDTNDVARPGTTKRRQYYYKRTAWAFTDCQPIIDTHDSEIDPPPLQSIQRPLVDAAVEIKKGPKRNMLYAIASSLCCALPERYNTRGRRLHAPQHAQQAIGILMARGEPDNLQIPSFPVYTRSGEVRVALQRVPGADARVSPARARLVRRFMRFVFAEVLRVRRRGMKLQSEGSTHNNYYIVPTIKITKEDGSSSIGIDWAFLELIYHHTEEKKLSEIDKPLFWHHDGDDTEEMRDIVKKEIEGNKVKKMKNPLLKDGEVFVFDPEKYKEAVVTPWYRNQDQPQFFLVAEICWSLTPDSAFPSSTHTSFRHYYSSKYGVELTQSNQPLLDVDHTSARLNLLTPRYVNRKGVALPVSSERTRRAKRDRLDQKQILVPELCRLHPFAAPLWFAIVALPCVLYRINALLIADEIRRCVAIDVGLGIPKIDEKSCPGFQWPPLHFGWSLAEVLSADGDKDKRKEDEDVSSKEGTTIDQYGKEKMESKEEKSQEDGKEKTLNDILQEEAEGGFEIGTWSNDMASSIAQTEFDEYDRLPPNLTFCTSASGGANWCDSGDQTKNQFNPRTFSMADSDCSYMSSDFDTDDSDFNSAGSDEDTDLSGFCSSKNSNAAMGVRIEYKTAHEAEAVDVERKSKCSPAPGPDPQDDERDVQQFISFITSGAASQEHIEKFQHSVDEHKKNILEKNFLIRHNETINEILPEAGRDNITRIDKSVKDESLSNMNIENHRQMIEQIFPYATNLESYEKIINNNQINLEYIEKNKRVLLADLKKNLSKEQIKKLQCYSMVDVDIDSPDYVNEKVSHVGFDDGAKYKKILDECHREFKPYYLEGKMPNGMDFDFDYQPDLNGHPGPSPSIILQALTMSNANDGINLERLETIGDSFLKFAITAYLYCAHPTVHEGKLSHMRSKQVSNLNLYRLGRNKRLGARMIASKFEPHDNWLPPCHKPPNTLHAQQTESRDKSQTRELPVDSAGCFIPYNLITQHSIPDKSIADCVEALIGAYLVEMGPRGALLLMSWLGIRVLPLHAASHKQKSEPPQPPSPKHTTLSDTDYSEDEDSEWNSQFEEEKRETEWNWKERPPGSLPPRIVDGQWTVPIYGELKAPPSPLLRYIEDPEGELEQMLSGYEALERTLQYRFKDRSLLLQALTHASHQQNPLTDCYQRLEFLGDAILDYLITRHLYCDSRRHSPGALTDLRSALVNNTIFATLAARHGFHKYFRHMSPGLNEVLTKYVKIQEENGHSISEEHYLIQEDEMEQAEDVEVPKALGDLFESVAGAIFLDSGMSLGAVWKSYVNLMGAELEAFSAAAPKSPVRELLEAEPDTAKFGKPERLADGRRVRVCVEVFGRGAFKGIGRNYRIAKGTAARCALRHLKKFRQQ